MKYLALLVLLVLATACTINPVVSEADFALTVTARGEVPPIPTIEPSLVPTVTPECLDIAGNISSSGEKIYHLPGQSNYGNVKIDKEGESWFCTEQAAIDAGFRKSQN